MVRPAQQRLSVGAGRALPSQIAMISRFRHSLIRNSEAGEDLELFLVTAVASVLAIRAYLTLTGYPQVGVSGLHIAHLVWGGLLMMAALMVGFSFLGSFPQRLSALMGGVGFGTFVDELGKYITTDNNYLYRPAIALIYILFVLLFLLIHYIRMPRPLGHRESLVNALSLVGETVAGGFDPEMKQRTLTLLEQADASSPLVQHLRRYMEQAKQQEDISRGIYFRTKGWLFQRYRLVVLHPWFGGGLITWFALQGIAQTFTVGELQFDILNAGYRSSEQTVVAAALAGSSFLHGVLVVVGILHWRASHLQAYRWFERAMLVSILVTQVFIFYDSELAALTGLAINLLVIAALRFMIHREEALPVAHK
ncbi:MAG: putative rane protein [Dehalococcoidia bacterium]|nr:putative rane protein [Dehalococcoidia bacterium]